MKRFCIACMLLLSTAPVNAHGSERALVVLHPHTDSHLMRVKDRLAAGMREISFEMYAPPEQTPEIPDETVTGLSIGKEDYEFLRFNESIDHLTAAISGLQTGIYYDGAAARLKDAYLYLALDYLALGRDRDAAKAVDRYVCIAGTDSLDPDLWPPNLLGLVERQKSTNAHTRITVTITAQPDDAEISMDGTSMGVQPVHTDILPCLHFITIKSRGHLTQKQAVRITGARRAISFTLAPDPLILENPSLPKERVPAILGRYKADALLILASGTTETTEGTRHPLQVSLFTAKDGLARHRTFNCSDEDREASLLIGFLQDEAQTRQKENTFLRPDRGRASAGREQPSKKWYKNKWLWTTGAAVAAASLVFVLTNGPHHGSTSTGSISIQW